MRMVCPRAKMGVAAKPSKAGTIVYWPERRSQPYTVWYRSHVVGFRATEREARGLLNSAWSGPTSRNKERAA